MRAQVFRCSIPRLMLMLMLILVMVMMMAMISSCSLQLVSSLLVLLLLRRPTVIADPVGGQKQQQLDILRRFSTKLLLTVDNNALGGQNPLHRLEIEELYDQERGLARIIIVNAARGERAELFYRAEDDIYLETVHGLESAAPAGSRLLSCTALIGGQLQPPPDGYYSNLLRSLTRGSSRKWPSVLLGPSVFLHPAQVNLLALSSERSAQVRRNTESDPGARLKDNSLKNKRHRFIAESSEGLRIYLSSEGKNWVFFRQADYMIERSPLLTHLATSLSYTSADSELGALNYSIDYLEIDNETLASSSDANRDLFKLPQVFGCLRNKPPEDQFGFAPTWSRFFQLRSSRFSTNVHAINLHPLGVHVAADMTRHLMRFDIDKRSRNVIDLQHELIYHMANEPDQAYGRLESDLINTGHDLQGDMNRANNSKCSIISSKSLPGLRALKQAEMALMKTHSSANRWAHLIGSPESVVYLGAARVHPGTGQRAHLFELSYQSSAKLSPFFILIFGHDSWQHLLQSKSGESETILVGKLWIKASESSCTKPINSHRPLDCIDPIVLRAELNLIEQQKSSSKGMQRQLQVIASREIRFSEFEWELADEDDLLKPDRIYLTFDRRSCPLERLELHLELEWRDEIAEDSSKPGKDFCQHRAHLDDLVFGQLSDYLLTYASIDVELMDMEMKQALPGNQVAQYEIILSQLPSQASLFTRRASMVSHDSLRLESVLLAKSDQFRLLFECLSWASQYPSSLAVLHSPVTGCFVYSNLAIDETQEPQDKGSQEAPDGGDKLFTLYTRKLEGIGSNPVGGLKLFKSEHMDAINLQIIRSNRDENQFEACLARPSGLSLLRDIRFGKLRLQGPAAWMQSRMWHVPAKSGYKFAETIGERPNSALSSSRQFEVVSLTDCRRRCDELPECGSFAHCKNIESQHELCQLSRIRLSSRLGTSGSEGPLKAEVEGGAKFVRQTGCRLYSKNYLLLFESARNGAELASGPDKQHQLRHWTQVGSGEVSEFECASLCHQREADCLRFLHCPALGACYHYEPTKGNSQLAVKVSDLNECSLFKKKPLGLYRRIMSLDFGPFDWTLDDESQQVGGPLRVETLAGRWNEEKCARLCTENVDCQSFDSCSSLSRSAKVSPSALPGPDTESLAQRRGAAHFECTLLSHSLSAGLMLVSNKSAQPEPSDHEPKAELSKHCTHYERQGVQLADELLIDQLTGPASSGSGSGLRPKGLANSRAAGLLSAALLGLTLGISANMLIVLVLLFGSSYPGAASWRAPRFRLSMGLPLWLQPYPHPQRP